MSFKLLGGSSDLNTIISDVNSNILELKNREVTEFFKDDSGIRRVMLGKGGGGFYGLKTSPENVDVYTATDDQLTFNSDQNVFKIVQSRSANTTVASLPISGAGSFTTGEQTIIPHGLGYIPAVLAYASGGTYSSLPLVQFAAPSAGGISVVVFSISVDIDNVYIGTNITAYALGASTTLTADVFPIKYYLLQESAS